MDYGTGWGDPSKHGVSDGWELVGPDRSRKRHFILRCKACGSESSYIKYQLGKPHGCSDCWYVEQIMRKPHLWVRLAHMIGAFTRGNHFCQYSWENAHCEVRFAKIRRPQSTNTSIDFLRSQYIDRGATT